MIRISKEIGLDAGHRIPRHLSKCSRLHGHRYRVIATLEAPEAAGEGSQEGMLLDFGWLKDLMMQVIHEPFDHKFIVFDQDPILGGWVDSQIIQPLVDLFRDSFVMVPFVPTAENLAAWWYAELGRALIRLVGEGICPANVVLRKMEVWETPTSVAVYQP